MLFNDQSRQIIILGYNESSFFLAKKLSVFFDVIILYYKKDFQLHLIEDIDIIIKEIESDLLTEIKEYIYTEDWFFLALTENEELNIFSTLIAQKLKARKTIAFIITNKYKQLDTGIDIIINPFVIFLQEIYKNIGLLGIEKINDIYPGHLKLVQIKIKPDDIFINLKIKETRLKDTIIAAIKRKNYYLLPSPDLELLPGDLLYLICKDKYFLFLKKLYPEFGKDKLFIIGGDDLSYFLFKYLGKFFKDITFIEPELEKCSKLASRLEKPLILHGKGTELKLLEEEGVTAKSLFLSISSEDEQNLLSSYGARCLNCKEIITLINSYGLEKIARLMKLSKTIFLPEIITRHLLNLIQDGFRIKRDLPGDVIFLKELNVKDFTPLVNKHMSKFLNQQGLFNCFLKSDQQFKIPDKKYKIQAGDILYFPAKKGQKI